MEFRASVNLDGKRATFYFRSVCSVAQPCLTLCGPMGFSPPGSSVRGILQARTLEWVAIFFSGDLPDPGITSGSLTSPTRAGGFFPSSATWEAPPLPKLSAHLYRQEEPPPHLGSRVSEALVGVSILVVMRPVFGSPLIHQREASSVTA